MKIRQCRPDDLTKVVKMLRSVGIIHSMELYELILSMYPDLVLVAEENGEIIGFCMASLISESVGHLMVLYAKPEFRRRGIGRKLLQEILKRLMANYKVKEVVLEVRKSNTAAINLYRSFGFFPVSLLPNYYEDEDGILMKKKIVPRLFSSLQ